MSHINILIPGSFITENSIDVALGAVAQLIDEVKPSKKKLVINLIEEGADVAALQVKLKGFGIAKYCTVISLNNQAQIEVAYNKADVILLPQKKCKISIIKNALSMKVIPICMNFEGINEYVDDSCAILISGKSKEIVRNQMAETLIILKEDREAIELLKEGAIRKYESAYCWGGLREKRSAAA